MDMDDDTTGGITLQNTMPPEETTTIDWDAVLRDFARPQSPLETPPPLPSPPPSALLQDDFLL